MLKGHRTKKEYLWAKQMDEPDIDVLRNKREGGQEEGTE